MRQIASLSQHREGSPASIPPERSWYDLDQPYSDFLHGWAAMLDVAVALAVLGADVTLFNAHRVSSVTAFLSMRVTVKNVFLLGTFTLFWIFLAYVFQQLASRRRPRFGTEARHVAIMAAIGAVPVLGFPLTTVSGAFEWLEFSAYVVASVPALIVGRALLRVAGNLLGPWISPVRHCVVVGSGPRAEMLAQSLEKSTDCRYEIIGFVDSGGLYSHPDILRRGLMGRVCELSEILRHSVVDEVVIALPVKSCYAEIQTAVTTCEHIGVQCRIPSDVFTYSIARPRLTRNESRPAITLDVVPHDGTLFIKRLLDLFGAGCGLIALIPLMLCAAAAIRLTSPGPVLFRQRRYGYNKRLFTMYKLRTMSVGAEEQQHELEGLNEMAGPVFKIADDPRITPVGRFLRRTSMDELPQLWNVLTGEMSLVGPRPLPIRDVSRFSEAWLMRRFSVKPGLTCLWQISGRNQVDFDRWIELDLEYIDNWSIPLDIRILCRTLGAVIRGAGAA